MTVVCIYIALYRARSMPVLYWYTCHRYSTVSVYAFGFGFRWTVRVPVPGTWSVQCRRVGPTSAEPIKLVVRKLYIIVRCQYGVLTGVLIVQYIIMHIYILVELVRPLRAQCSSASSSAYCVPRRNPTSWRHTGGPLRAHDRCADPH